MNKLELKHLSPYLPYELKVESISIYGKINKPKKAKVIKELTVGNLWSFIGEKSFESKKCLPILRPLSDLYREIEQNGVKFIPCHELAKISMNNRRNCDFDIRSNKYDWSTIIGNLDCYRKLLEWHFDVFGLIEKGLAIDINTLK